jgi:hypothetical protein
LGKNGFDNTIGVPDREEKGGRESIMTARPAEEGQGGEDVMNETPASFLFQVVDLKIYEDGAFLAAVG